MLVSSRSWLRELLVDDKTIPFHCPWFIIGFIWIYFSFHAYWICMRCHGIELRFICGFGFHSDFFAQAFCCDKLLQLEEFILCGVCFAKHNAQWHVIVESAVEDAGHNWQHPAGTSDQSRRRRGVAVPSWQRAAETDCWSWEVQEWALRNGGVLYGCEYAVFVM